MIPLISNATADQMNTSVSSMVTYICDSGHRFLDHSEIKTIRCEETLKWNNTLDSCKRKTSFLLQWLCISLMYMTFTV